MAKSGKGVASAAPTAVASKETTGVFIDAFAFVRLGKQAEGKVPLARMLRAVEGLPQQQDGERGEVHWRLRGELGGTGEYLLKLQVQGSPMLVCQRCMEPFAFPIDAEVTLQLVRRESDLDEDSVFSGRDTEDDEGDEDMDEDGAPGSSAAAPEKVVGSHRFDVLAQVEDELILNIPYVPRHEVCPGTAGKADEEEPESVKRPSPFAVLEKLKQKN
ncbi:MULTISPECIES: DUF177 domain-containing protein [unclassified Achromobacter]|uniref:YceD family protein n=1 Tax=unclassified Achromobacter TaxID=2626865 RepID=UPI000B5181B8|nr:MULTISPECIES: YceD family protein [unclassified Achromobacter]OWT77506.1 hypothetical protein CEY04_16315 [Achromobacter sp. HZ28]OWT78387.1 hypothetical protein CEY05_10810 [Achromobacter sp. HZ34]